MMKTTPWKLFGGGKQRIRVKYGLDYDFARRNNQQPHFSVTCDIEEARGGRWKESGGGAAHELIAQNFKDLEPYLKWHLVSLGEPMHYLANAKYWWEQAMGKTKPTEHQRVDPRDAFKSTIVFGGIPGEKTLPYTNDWADVEEWLKGRLPKLMGRFSADMKSLGVLE